MTTRIYEVCGTFRVRVIAANADDAMVQADNLIKDEAPAQICGWEFDTADHVADA